MSLQRKLIVAPLGQTNSRAQRHSASASPTIRANPVGPALALCRVVRSAALNLFYSHGSLERVHQILNRNVLSITNAHTAFAAIELRIIGDHGSDDCFRTEIDRYVMLLIAETGPMIPLFESRHFVSHRQSSIGDHLLETRFQVDQSVTANFGERIKIFLRTGAHVLDDIPRIPSFKSNPMQTEMERLFVLSVQ